MTCIEGNRNSCRALVGSFKERDDLEDLDIDGMVILQYGKYAYNAILSSLAFLRPGTISVCHTI